MDGCQADDLFLFLEGLDAHFLLNTVDHLLDVARCRPLLDEHNRHAAPNVVASGAVHQIAAVTIQADVHLRPAILVIAGLSVGDLVTSDDQVALELDRRTPLLTELEGLGCRTGSISFGRQPELEVRSLAQDTLGFSRVLNPRKLNYDAVGTLTLNQRLGDSQLIDPVTDGGQVLLDRILADLR